MTEKNTKAAKKTAMEQETSKPEEQKMPETLDELKAQYPCLAKMPELVEPQHYTMLQSTQLEIVNASFMDLIAKLQDSKTLSSTEGYKEMGITVIGAKTMLSDLAKDPEAFKAWQPDSSILDELFYAFFTLSTLLKVELGKLTASRRSGADTQQN